MKKQNEVKISWKPINNSFTGLKENNFVLSGKGFYISYNPDSQRSYFGARFDQIINEFNGKNDGGEETALVKNRKYYVLNGDFRKEYEKLLGKGFKKCKEFFDSKKEFKSSFSIE